ncbi:MAG: hypothetical protein WBI53_04535 [Paludibacter sp.]
MKKQLLFGIALVCSAFLTNVMAAEPAVDPATYPIRGTMKLTNKWLYSNKLGNYNVAADFVAASGMARGMAVKDGKMLFIDRGNKQIVVVNGATGAKEAPIALASNLFTYIGRNKANTADSIWTAGLWGFQDIKIDNAGNVLLGNIITSNAGRFQIWKVDLSTGAGTLVIDQPDLATLFPAATSMRFDAFGVWGDVNSTAVILAANASATAMEVYKWTITNGVASAPSLIELDNSTATGADLAGLANLGSAPQVFPLDDNYFYVDGNATFPVLVDKDGNVIDGFKSNLSALKDSVTAPAATPKTIWTMNQGHNGVVEFEVTGEYFLLMAATNTVGVPPSTFRLFKFADAGKAFTGLDCLWTFPQAGMGASSNAYRTAMPCVEVSGNIAKIYVYTGENGYGMYEFNTLYTGLKDNEISEVMISLSGNQIRISEEVAFAEIISITGQRIVAAKNISTLDAPTTKGVYLVSVIDKNGAQKIQKVVMN